MVILGCVMVKESELRCVMVKVMVKMVKEEI